MSTYTSSSRLPLGLTRGRGYMPNDRRGRGLCRRLDVQGCPSGHLGTGPGGVTQHPQGYNARLDEHLGARHGVSSQNYGARRHESEGMERSLGNRKYQAVRTMDLTGKGPMEDLIAAAQATLPGEELRKKLLKSSARKEARKKGKASRTKCCLQGEVKKRRPVGNVIYVRKQRKLCGGNLDPKTILKVVYTKVLPSLIKELDINPEKLKKTVVKKAMKLAMRGVKSVKDATSRLSKVLLGVLAKSKIGSLIGRTVKSLKGSGLGGRAMKLLAKLLASKLQRVLGNLMTGKGLFLAGSGKGGSFWSDFKKGFMKVIRPAAKILGPVAGFLAGGPPGAAAAAAAASLI